MAEKPRHRSRDLVFELISLALKLDACISVAVLIALVHCIHDVLQFVHLLVMLGADQRALRLKLTHQRRLLFTEL